MGFATRRRPPSARPLLLVAAALAATLGAVELGARTLSPTPAEHAVTKAAVRGALFQHDAQLQHTPRPLSALTIWTPEWQSTVSINALGMRGPRPDRLPSSGRRVLALGDSFTFAMQVDDQDSFVRRLEADLSQDAPTHVWNAGADDYGTFQALGRARRELERGIRFDAIVLTMFLGNDLGDNAREHTRRGAPGRRVSPSPEQRADMAPRWVSHEWAHLLFQRWQSGRDKTFARQVAKDFRIWCDDDALQEVLPKTLTALDALRSLAETHDTPLVVALAPPQWVLDPDKGVELGEWLQVDGFDPSRVTERLKAELHPSVAVVDLTEPLRTAAHTDAVTYRYDAHWTPRGHAVVAEALAPKLRQTLRSSKRTSDTRLVDVVPGRQRH